MTDYDKLYQMLRYIMTLLRSCHNVLWHRVSCKLLHVFHFGESNTVCGWDVKRGTWLRLILFSCFVWHFDYKLPVIALWLGWNHKLKEDIVRLFSQCFMLLFWLWSYIYVDIMQYVDGYYTEDHDLEILTPWVASLLYSTLISRWAFALCRV
jgi:hypothetical protein